MGAGISSSGAENNDDGGSISRSSGPSLGDIPESCISFLLMSFDPQEICQLARVNKAFHRASSADFVWESKLPPTYKFLVNKVLGEENLGTMTKKEIYAKLCRPNFFDDGTKVSITMYLQYIRFFLSFFFFFFLSLHLC